MAKLGPEVANWKPARPPAPVALQGRTVRLEPVDVARHEDDLYRAATADPATWDYLPHGPFSDCDAFRDWLQWAATTPDNVFLVIVDGASGRAQGMASYMRAVPAHGVIEIGYIWFAPRLQRTTAATEAIYLLLRHAFDDLGYRRVEWKCNDLNAASCRAAIRFGFVPEGTFRQHMIVKGRNRDTAWFAMLDQNWPAIREAFRTWLSPDNFDESGRQHRPLAMPGAGARSR